MDMGDPYIAAVRSTVPGGEEKIVFGRFHVMRHVSKAVDDVRRQDHKERWSQGDATLKGTRHLWLWAAENIPAWRRPEFAALQRKDLKVGRAWAIKENLRRLWACGSEPEARSFFGRWYGWARRSRLAPVVKAARTLKHYVGGILRSLRHRITNACVEDLNSKIETIKKMACGFRNREHYKTAIYFHCGGLDLYPTAAT
jgi:transposase